MYDVGMLRIFGGVIPNLEELVTMVLLRFP